MIPVLKAVLKYALVLLFVAGPALATPIPESCADERGRTIAVEADYAQAPLVRIEQRQQMPVIRYNPRVLSRLTPGMHLFFVAQACARAGSATASPTYALAHRADCTAYRMLQTNGYLNESELADFARQFVFSAEEWEKLPGPPRAFHFGNCDAAGNLLRLPPTTPPSARQSDWNACAHACGDRLWHCQRGGDQETCLNAYDTCLKGCGEPPAAPR